MPWIAVDFDGTLAHYVDWDRHGLTLGPPIPEMVMRVQQWLAQEKDVRILTARVCSAQEPDMALMQRSLLTRWCVEHIGVALPLTSEKDFHLVELWDDRAVRVRKNEGAPCCDHWDERERERPRNRPEVEFMRAATRAFAITLYAAQQLALSGFMPPTGPATAESAGLWINNDAGANAVVNTLCHQALQLAKMYDKAEMARLNPPLSRCMIEEHGHPPGECNQ